MMLYNEFSDKIYETLHAQSSLLSIFVDFSKAFDTVRYDILLFKLNLMASVELSLTGSKTTSVTEPSLQIS